MIHKSYEVAIRKNSTGEIKILKETLDWDTTNNYGHVYWWAEGNFGCDCNRAIQFGDYDESCGESRFSVLYVELPDGTIIPIDTDPAHGRDFEDKAQLQLVAEKIRGSA